MCLNPYCVAKFSYYLLANCEPLSVWQICGMPNRAEQALVLFMTGGEGVQEFIDFDPV